MDAAVSAVAGVVGSLSVDFHVSLSAMDVQYAFVVAQGGRGNGLNRSVLGACMGTRLG